MKKVILLVLTTLIMMGCEERESINHIEGFNIVKIDSCEYIEQHTYGYIIYTHKGNCRFCEERKERRQKELKELIEQLKELIKQLKEN